jgi:hypothetical protein
MAALFATGNAQTYKATMRADLDLDGRSDLIDLDSGRASTLQVRRGRKVLWQGVPRAWKPWRLAIADVDGDGRPEIILGITKPTKFFAKPHNCLFIYGWDGERAFPKWLGSSLGRPFTDFLFVNTDEKSGDELIALETTLEGNKALALYRWNGFGFTLERQSATWKTARILGTGNRRISLEADGEIINLPIDLERSGS